MNRRQALGAFGTVSLGALLAACGGDDPAGTGAAPAGTSTAAPQREPGGDLAALFDDAGSCSPTVEQTAGPFYFDADAIRSDIREDREGTPLRLGIRVRDASCEPVANAVVDIWQCDAGGLYSGFNGGEDERFLRGTQVTDRDGVAEFLTVYPGWYQGRTVHIHAKVHLNRTDVLTTQLYFDESVTDEVHARSPYSDRGQRDAGNESDGIFDPSLVLTLSENGDGYIGLINFDLA